MATFTITTPVNIDTLVGRTGGDTFTINGGFLTVDEDTRYGLNANTSAIYAAITPSATLGGSVLFDGRAIWLIPFTSGSGVVPAFNTTISKGGASGLLIGVYSALNAAPLAPAAAMPATGYIKVKQWNGTLYGTGALTGLTADAAAGENVGWLEVVGQEGSLCLLSSLNQQPSGAYDGSFAKGDWYTVGTTDGNRATSYQVPSNGSAVWHGAFMVDKAAATAITAATWSAGVATFTSTAHGLATDDRVMVDAILPRTWRTVDTQRCTVIDANTFTVPMETNPGSYTSGGTVAAQEWWAVTDSLNTKVGSESYRGKHCWLGSATGLLRFGNDNTTSTGGDVPASGLVIRMPNITTQSAASGAKTVNTHSTSVTTRWRYYNGNAGTIRASHLSGAWSTASVQTGKACYFSDCTFTNHMALASQAAPCTVTNVGVGGNANAVITSVFLISAMNAAVTVLDSCFSTGEMATRFPISLSNSYGGVSFDRCRFTGTGDRTAATYGVNANIGLNATFTDCGFGPHSIATSSQFSDVDIKPFTYYSAAYGFNQIANTAPTVNLSNLSRNWEVSDPTPLGTAPLARTSLLFTASGSDSARLRNWGTEASPIDMRLNGEQLWKAWTRVTTTATVTEVGHPYRVGDQCFVFDTTAATAIIRGVKTITAVTANDFSFTCLNAGATSGSLSYYVGGVAALISMATTSDTILQNVHIRGNTAQPLSTTNTCFGLTLDNVTTEPRIYNLSPAFAANNMRVRSMYGNDYAVHAQQASVFGTHFTDLFQREPGTAIPGQAAAVTGVSWTRVTTLCTVTSPAHGLDGATQRIWVENSSNPAAIANGWGVTAITLIPLDANTFTFACLNSGATSGTLDYWLVGDSTYRVVMNEASPETVGQAEITVNAGAAGFTGAGTLVLPAVGDQATWIDDEFIIGYESFGRTPALPYGSGVSSASQAQVFDIAYDMDLGPGFSGTWQNAAYYGGIGGGWGASGANTVTVTNSSGIQINDYCMGGIGIASNTQVLSKEPGKLTMTNAATSTASAPDSAALQLASSFTLDAKLTLANWSAPVGNGCIISKGDNSSLTKGYYFRFTAGGTISLAVGFGSSAASVTSSVSTSTVFTNGSPGWVRAVWDQPASEVKFYWRLLDTDPWTQLGTTQTLTGAGVGTSASTFYIGQRTTGNDYLAADIYRIRVYSDATQTTSVFDADFSTNTTGAPTFTESVNGAVVTTVGCQQVTLSAANTAAVSGVLVFWYMPNEAAFPSTGVRFKVRMTANTVNAGTIYQCDLPLLSSSTSRARLYSQAAPVPLSILVQDGDFNPISGARIYIAAEAGGPETAGTVLLTGVTNGSGILTGSYGYTADQPIGGWVRKATGSPAYKQALVGGAIGSEGYSSTVFLVEDE